MNFHCSDSFHIWIDYKIQNHKLNLWFQLVKVLVSVMVQRVWLR